MRVSAAVHRGSESEACLLTRWAAAANNDPQDCVVLPDSAEQLCVFQVFKSFAETMDTSSRTTCSQSVSHSNILYWILGILLNRDYFNFTLKFIWLQKRDKYLVYQQINASLKTSCLCKLFDHVTKSRRLLLTIMIVMTSQLSFNPTSHIYYCTISTEHYINSNFSAVFVCKYK